MNQRYSHARARLLTAYLSLLALVGCGGPYDATVSGTVKFNGSPVPRGTISFKPQSAGADAFGQINADGAYLLRTGREEGLNSGSYTVSVAANETPPPNPKGGPPPMGKSLTPDWYRDPATSGLTFTVAPGDNTIDIDLNATPPPGWKPPPARRR
ncbi:carboxypeptidase-like regulatory domain-containing protein [Lacipirellula limnantheis]|uniref:Carboxypeptidase regulatory-like domain-containing protein n=1 Tax=Lacipirellula limnantheis TaxID=2528024 RepID=A0A517TZT5_9BACT|nr:carboxypeptidase-like regulatory domain-containing protein [Lacipirellula limnantheis]QDT73882.1 hypothetical protein I41_30730 [Lacipirellula limnantheis]